MRVLKNDEFAAISMGVYSDDDMGDPWEGRSFDELPEWVRATIFAEGGGGTTPEDSVTPRSDDASSPSGARLLRDFSEAFQNKVRAIIVSATATYGIRG